MHWLSRLGLTLVAMGLAVLPAAAQAPGGVAATVNGQEIPEAALQRQLARVPANRLAEVRKHHLETLIDNVLIDQYLVQLKVTVEKKDVDAKLAEVYEEIKKQGQAVEKVFKELSLTEVELRTHLEAELRWEKFCAQQATEAELKKFFDGNREAFDGTQVRVRHILIAAPAGDAKAAEQAKEQLQQIKRQVEDAAAAALAKLPAGADPLAKEKARTEALEQAFAALAREKSACPSKERGGDTDWFPRSGGMVEPFARAAFALKPYQMSDIVQTPWGYHLILATDRKPGKEVKYDDVKAEVKEVYGERLRDAVVAYMRPRAKITINSPQSRP